MNMLCIIGSAFMPGMPGQGGVSAVPSAFELIPLTHHRKTHVILHGHHHLHLVKIATPRKHLIRDTVSVWRLPIPMFLLALIVLLCIFDLLSLLRRLFRALRGDDNIVIRVFVRIVVVPVLNIIALVRSFPLSIRGILLLLLLNGLQLLVRVPQDIIAFHACLGITLYYTKCGYSWCVDGRDTRCLAGIGGGLCVGACLALLGLLHRSSFDQCLGNRLWDVFGFICFPFLLCSTKKDLDRRT